MKIVKILEHQLVIRLFGIGLIIAPFMNTVLSISMLSSSDNKWTSAFFFKVLSSGAISTQVLYVASLILGLVMLSGSASVWKFVLVILGGHLINQIMHLGQIIRAHWIYGVLFLINVGIFIFIIDQLVWKDKPVAKPTVKPKPKPDSQTQSQMPLHFQPQSQPQLQVQNAAPPVPPKPVARPVRVVRAKAKVVIHFEGLGPWAQLLNISSKGFRVRRLAEPPPEIEKREVNLKMPNGLTLRSRLAQQTDQDYFFEYAGITSAEVQKLNQWLTHRAA